MPYIGKEPVVGNFVKLDAITTSATATFALTQNSAAFTPESANQMIVSLNGVIQAPGTAFTLSGSNIVFASALTSSDVIDFILVLGSVLDVGTPTDDTVSTAKLKSNAVTAAKIAPATITTSEIAPATIASSNIAPATIASSNIAPATIAASNIAPGTITTTQIAPNTVAASNIAPGTITTTEISPAVPLGVPAVTSNPPTPSLSLGDMFLRTDLSAPGNLKAFLAGPLAFATGGDMHNAPGGYQSTFGCGTQNDATTCGGYRGTPSPYYLSTTQSYNGSAWSTGPAYPTGLTVGILGSPGSPGSNCWFAGGLNPGGPTRTETNEWNGTTHSASGALPTAQHSGVSQGTIPDGMYVGGSPATTNVYDYNGTSWSSGTSLPTAIFEAGGTMVGPPTNAAFAGGRNSPSSPYPGVGYEWNGSSWSTFPAAPAQPSTQAGNGYCFGADADSFYLAGYEIPPGYNTTTTVQKYNGSSWVSATAMPRSCYGSGVATAGNTASSGSGLLYGGSNPAINNPSGQTRSTLEWSDGNAIVDLN